MAHISASQIQLFKDCPRKWGFKYIQGKDAGEPSDSLALGSAVHTVLENFLKDGTEPDTETLEGKIASTGVNFLRQYTEYYVEEPLDSFPAPPSPIPFKGFIDLYIENDGGVPHVLDHKTTSGLRWAKTEEELRTNIQLMIYAKHALLKHSDADIIRLSHIYYTTKPPFQSKQITIEVNRKHVDAQFDIIMKSVYAMHQRKEENAPEKLTKRKTYCNSFNKVCEYIEECESEDMTSSKQQKDILAFLLSEEVQQEQEVQEVQEVEEPKIEEPKLEEGCTTLYVGCRPIGSQLKDFSSFCYQFEFELTDGRTFGSVPFGQGWESLLIKLRSTPIPAGEYFLSSQGALYTKLVDLLPTLFKKVVIREA